MIFHPNHCYTSSIPKNVSKSTLIRTVHPEQLLALSNKVSRLKMVVDEGRSSLPKSHVSSNGTKNTLLC